MTRTVADCESEIQDLKQALEEERKYTEGLQEECEEMTIRLERIHWHLRSGAIRDALDKLADYAGGYINGDAVDHRAVPIKDPFPESSHKKTRRRK